MTSRNTRQFGPTRVERVTFEIQADSSADVLPRVVMLFHRLNVEIQALYMVRRRGAETMRVNVTIEADANGARRLEANLHKVVQVRSVNTARRTKEPLSDPRDRESKG